MLQYHTNVMPVNLAHLRPAIQVNTITSFRPECPDRRHQFFEASVILKHFSKVPVPGKIIGTLLFGVSYWKNQNWDVSDYAIEDEFAFRNAELPWT
jgi:hypothetical protein